jgi:hypothetical protein
VEEAGAEFYQRAGIGIYFHDVVVIQLRHGDGVGEVGVVAGFQGQIMISGAWYYLSKYRPSLQRTTTFSEISINVSQHHNHRFTSAYCLAPDVSALAV